MAQQIPVDPAGVVGANAAGETHAPTPDLASRRLGIVNVVFAGAPGAGDRGWVLIDAGIIGTISTLVASAKARFGADARPAAIVMTHGHFDHVGGLPDLAEQWDVPVYAHSLELPYLNGSKSYPPPDPSVGGGMMARLSPLFPRGPIDVGDRLRALPEDGSVPHMPGWRWMHTPGHAPGHVSLWRESDRSLIAGDAFITTAQESAYAAATQEPELHGPPVYFTPDWMAARASVERLAALEPEVALTGHGQPIQGPALREALHRLANEFDQVAIPAHGRYVPEALRKDT